MQLLKLIPDLTQMKEIALLIFQCVGIIVTAIIFFGWVIYLIFYRTVTIEELNEDEYREEDFIDQMLQQ